MKISLSRLSFSWIVLFLCSFLFAAADAQEAGPQEEMIPEEAQQQKWTQNFQEAEKVFNSENQANSIPLFQDLISQITEEKGRRTLPEPERLLLLKSLDYLGQAFFLEGQQEESSKVFVKLLELEPNYRMNEDLVSSKIIAFLENLRAENLGVLSIASDPPGATIKIDGATAGTTDVAALYSLKGEHDLEITRPGYLPVKQTITVTPGKTEKLKFTLERSSSVAYFVTHPKAVEIFLDGKRLGITEGETSERGKKAATEQNLNPSDFSAEFPIADLQPGEYIVEFRKACWETPPRKITITENKDYLFEPIILVPSPAYLNITANDPQGNIFIDNDYKGLAPKQKLEVCSGKHLVKIKGPLGKFEKQIELKKDETLAIAATLNPSLAFLGIVDAANAEALNARIVQQLSGLKTLNFQDQTNVVEEGTTGDMLRQILDGLKTNKPDAARKAKIQEITNRLESDLLLIGRSPADATEGVTLYLLSNGSSMFDQRTLRSSDSKLWQEFKEQLDYESSLFEKRLGFSIIDTAIASGPVISQIAMKTFEDSQPLQTGDVIVAINDAKVSKSKDVTEAIRALQSSDQVNVIIQRSGTQLTVPVRMHRSPVEVQFDHPNLLFNRQLVHFKKLWSLSTDPLEKNIANLNIGLCYAHFAEHEEALNQYRQTQLDRQAGLGQGTVKYREAQSYRELGSFREAQASLAEAGRFPKNTVVADDGPPLPREVERLQKAAE